MGQATSTANRHQPGAYQDPSETPVEHADVHSTSLDLSTAAAQQGESGFGASLSRLPRDRPRPDDPVTLGAAATPFAFGNHSSITPAASNVSPTYSASNDGQAIPPQSGTQTLISSASAAKKPAPDEIRSRRHRIAERFINMRRRSSQRLSWAFSGASRSGQTSPRESINSSIEPEAIPIASTSNTSRTNMEVTDTQEAATSAASSAEHPRDPYRLMTPPPEEDVMFEERQRARQMVEAALDQLQTDLARPRSPRQSSSSAARYSLPEGSRSFSALQTQAASSRTPEPSSPVTAISLSNHNTDQHSDMQVDSLPASSTGREYADVNPRIYAPLPRRSASSSPTLAASTVHPSVMSIPNAASPNTLAVPALEPSTQQFAPSAAPALTAQRQATIPSQSDTMSDLLVPRRILVQGIVSSSPPSTPPLAFNSRQPGSTGYNTEIESTAESESPADSGFWGELPGPESMSGAPWERPQARETNVPGLSDDGAWEDVVAEVLAQSPHHMRRSLEDSRRNLQEQGNLIGRLLCVAAAATAATLLPGITVNGAPVAGFGEAQAGETPMATMNSSGHSTSLAPSESRGRSDSLGTFRTPRSAPPSGVPGSTTRPDASSPSPGAAGASSASLQEILRSALAAAFRTPPASQSSEDSGSHAVTEASSQSPSEPLSSSLPVAASSPVHTSVSSPSPSPSSTGAAAPSVTASPAREVPRQPFSQPFGEALAIPVASLHAEMPYISGGAHPLGSFERFLADLQADVSTAITRSREVQMPASTSSPSQPARRDSLSGLEEMRPLLDDIEEVASPTRQELPQEADSEATPTTPESVSTPPRQPFSFFRSYQFAPRPLDHSASQGNTPLASSSGIDLHGNPVPAVSSEDTTMQDAEASAESRSHTNSLTASNGLSTNPSRTDAAASNTLHTPQEGPAPGEIRTRQVVPMLLVGVRSASLQALSAQDGASGAGSMTDAAVRQRSQDGEEIASSPTTGRAQPAAPSATSASEGSRAGQVRESRGFVLWILGGLYPPNHPIVLAPSLLGDDAMSYDDLLRLSEMLGNVKPATVTVEQIKESDLKIVKTERITELLAAGDIRDITAERCLVCLEDYEADEDIRILNCRHCFHQGCVDTWLSTGANTCPACRTVGVSANTAEVSRGTAPSVV